MKESFDGRQLVQKLRCHSEIKCVHNIIQGLFFLSLSETRNIETNDLLQCTWNIGQRKFSCMPALKVYYLGDENVASQMNMSAGFRGHILIESYTG